MPLKRCSALGRPSYAVGPITCQRPEGHEGEHTAWKDSFTREGDAHSWANTAGTGFCVVCYPGSDPPHVDTFSGGYGDIYTTREEAEDILYLTRSTMSIHRPLDRYELAAVSIIPVKEGEERRAIPSDPFYEG